MEWYLFLDDERFPAEALWEFDAIMMARSSVEAQVMVEKMGLPKSISFDHDLGGDDTGFKFMWWLIDGHLDGRWDLSSINSIQIHSANEVGAKKMMSLWENFFRTQAFSYDIKRVWPGGKG